MSGSPPAVDTHHRHLAGLLRGQLAPVGEPIHLERTPGAVPEWRSAGYRYLFLSSGTAALSVAMALAAELRGLAKGKVVLPAYGCPDLLAAAHYAGLLPVLADLRPDQPRYDLDAVRRSLSGDTAAVVAVNFLGIPEDLAGLRALCDARGVLLIEDDAQYFPLRRGCYEGDLVVHSFGRGKPVSQLGGGALLARGELAERALARGQILPEASSSEAGWRLKARLFNRVLHPLGYQVLVSLPLIDVGATVYKPLRQVYRLPGWRISYLSANIAAYRMRSRVAQGRIDSLLQQYAPALNLPRTMHAQGGPLLRYPLLCQSVAQREALQLELQRRGLGVTQMYRRPLPDIEGIPERIEGSFPEAASFASRLLTVPTTSFVNSRHLASLEQAVRVAVGD